MRPRAQDLDDDADALVETIVAALPEPTFDALPWGAETVRGCLRELSRATRDRNPLAIRAWLDFQRHTPEPEHLLSCLDAAIAHLTLRDVNASRALQDVRQAAIEHLDAVHGRRRRTDMITKDTLDLVDGLVKVVAAYDPLTAEHLDDVGRLAERLARAAGADEETVVRSTLTGRLHDVGKIAISRKVLLKPMELSAAEWDEMKEHPVHGASILRGIPRLERIAHLVELHHERIDGEGYPYRLKGSDIPYESRLVAIVDAFHAMVTVRAYRRPLSPAEACEELIRCAGAQFDEELVAAFVRDIGHRRVRSRRASER